jgi:hypothetical protein
VTFNRINPAEATLIQKIARKNSGCSLPEAIIGRIKVAPQGVEATEVQIYQPDLLDTVAALC